MGACWSLQGSHELARAEQHQRAAVPVDWGRLPDELLIECLSRLPAAERHQSAVLVCKRWAKLCSSPELLRDLGEVNVGVSSPADRAVRRSSSRGSGLTPGFLPATGCWGRVPAAALLLSVPAALQARREGALAIRRLRSLLRWLAHAAPHIRSMQLGVRLPRRMPDAQRFAAACLIVEVLAVLGRAGSQLQGLTLDVVYGTTHVLRLRAAGLGSQGRSAGRGEGGPCQGREQGAGPALAPAAAVAGG